METGSKDKWAAEFWAPCGYLKLFTACAGNRIFCCYMGRKKMGWLYGAIVRAAHVRNSAQIVFPLLIDEHRKFSTTSDRKIIIFCGERIKKSEKRTLKLFYWHMEVNKLWCPLFWTSRLSSMCRMRSRPGMGVIELTTRKTRPYVARHSNKRALVTNGQPEY